MIKFMLFLNYGISAIFGIVLLGAIISLDIISIIFFGIIGLIFFPPFQRIIEKKKKIKLKRRMKIIAMFILLIIYGTIISDKNIDQGEFQQENTVNIVEIKENQDQKIVFDLDVSHGKNIDELKDFFGEPSQNTEPKDLQINITSENQLAKERDKTREKDGYELYVTYNVKTREIIDFFVETNDNSGATKNIEGLIKSTVEKLNINYNKYKIEPVEAIGKKGFYTGIKIIPIK